MKKLIFLLIAAVGVSVFMSNNEYVEIPSTSIRMRVIANSDSSEDQNNKKIVKSAVEEKLYEITEGEKDYNKIDNIIESNKDILDNVVDDVIKKNNLGLEFKSNYGMNYFPEKTFKGLTYEAGNYKSYVVTLGEGSGENWWCVLYPPLCLVDEEKSDYEYHSLIKDALEKYN